LAGEDGARSALEQKLELVASVALMYPLHALLERVRVRWPVRIAASSVVQTALHELFRAALGTPAVLADQRGGVEQGCRTQVDQTFQDAGVFPDALVTLWMCDHRSESTLPAYVEQASFHEGWKVDCIELEQDGTVAGVG